MSSGLRQVEHAAEKRDLELDLAVSLVLERYLIKSAIGHVPVRTAIGAVEDASRSAQVVEELSSSMSAYLRALREPPGSAVPFEPRLPSHGTPTFAVSARLTQRARSQPLSAAFEPGAVEEAIRWEVAALLGGLTMTEWASLTVVSYLAERAGGGV